MVSASVAGRWGNSVGVGRTAEVGVEVEVGCILEWVVVAAGRSAAEEGNRVVAAAEGSWVAEGCRFAEGRTAVGIAVEVARTAVEVAHIGVVDIAAVEGK